MRAAWFTLIAATCLLSASPLAEAGRKDKKAPAPPTVEAAPEVVPKVAGSEVLLAMHRNLSLTEKLRDQVVGGDLDGARETGRVLSRQPPLATAPSHWVPWLRQIRDSAGRVEDAWDLETAGRTTAEIARVCGSCHRAEGKGPKFDGDVAAAEGEGLAPHMQHHKGAMQAMWEGLVSADDARFTAAAEALAAAELSEGDSAKDVDDMVHRLAGYGARVRGIAARADTYGALLATCSRCHEGKTP